MGKDSGSDHTTSTVTQNSLPEYAEPYVLDAMQWAQGISQRPYEAYTEPRISPFGDDQLQAFDLTRDMGGVGAQNYQDANALTGQAAGVMGGAGYTPGAFTNQTVASQNWDQNAAQQYMSPYLSEVMDTVLARNQDLFGQQQLQRNSRASRAGSFGGLRQGVEDAVAQQQFGLNQAMQEAGLLNQGYNTAFQNFSADQGRGLQASLANQSTDLDRQRMQEASNQEAARLGQTQAQGLGALGLQQAQLGAQDRDWMTRQIDALRSTGLDQQRQTQASLDLGYEDFVNQRDYEMQMLNFYNSILRGMPISSNSNVVNTEASNPYSQYLGMGLGAAGLINALGDDGSGGTG